MSDPEKNPPVPSQILLLEGVQRYTTHTPVWAAPMKLGDYAKLRSVELPPEESPDADGFLVEQVGTEPNVVGFGGSIVWMVKEYFETKFEVSDILRQSAFGEKMLGELSELHERTQRLETFLKSEKFSELPTAEQLDMTQQLKAMQDYVWFLSRRVRRLGETNANA